MQLLGKPLLASSGRPADLRGLGYAQTATRWGALLSSPGRALWVLARVLLANQGSLLLRLRIRIGHRAGGFGLGCGTGRRTGCCFGGASKAVVSSPANQANDEVGLDLAN